jgi:hypothetical protein
METPRFLTRKLALALAAYLILALVATFLLDGMIRSALYFFYALLAWRTVMAAKSDSDED